MKIERPDIDERQARLDKMIAEFRAARQRRLVNHGMTLWNRTEKTPHQAAAVADLPPTKIN